MADLPSKRIVARLSSDAMLIDLQIPIMSGDGRFVSEADGFSTCEFQPH